MLRSEVRVCKSVRGVDGPASTGLGLGFGRNCLLGPRSRCRFFLVLFDCEVSSESLSIDAVQETFASSRGSR